MDIFWSNDFFSIIFCDAPFNSRYIKHLVLRYLNLKHGHIKGGWYDSIRCVSPPPATITAHIYWVHPPLPAFMSFLIRLLLFHDFLWRPLKVSDFVFPFFSILFFNCRYMCAMNVAGGGAHIQRIESTPPPWYVHVDVSKIEIILQIVYLL